MIVEIYCKDHNRKIGKINLPDNNDSNYPNYSAGETSEIYCKECGLDKRYKTISLEEIKRHGKSKFDI